MTDPEVAGSVDLSKSDGTTDATTESTTGTPRKFPVVSALLAVALIGALTALIITMTALSDRKAQDDATNAARAAAIGYAVSMSTYDYKTADKDFSWMDSAGTDAFKREFQGKLDDIKKLVIAVKSTAKGTVPYATTYRDDNSHVTVQLSVDQSLTSATSKDPKTASSNLVMSMVKQNGKWLVDKLVLR